jgi:hypothetical protein
MTILFPLLALVLCVLRPVSADCKSITFFADGAVIEQDAAAVKGTIDISLPADMLPGSLRVKPLNGTALLQVDIQPAAADAGQEAKGLNSLIEQRNRLNDRMKALATREEIFTSAAKSQSAKAPRKSKTNPDPMQAIRQGTDFAIAQLEAVYTSRRRTEQEIRRLDSRIAAAGSKGQGAGTLARIRLSPAKGRVIVRYAVSGQGWTPRYDIFLDGSHTAQFDLTGMFGGTYPGYLLQVSPATLSEYTTALVFPVQGGPSPRLAGYRLPVSDERFGNGIQSSFSFVVNNTQPLYLPGGDASLYRNGEYVGRFRFEGISSGRSRKVSAGM